MSYQNRKGIIRIMFYESTYMKQNMKMTQNREKWRVPDHNSNVLAKCLNVLVAPSST